VAQERDAVRVDRGDEKIRIPREVASRVFVAVA
jgi:DtxR family Mn-dependent transcriptional regulator